MKEKHLPFFNILKALKGSECPVCLLIKKSIESYFEGLLYENINDVGFRTCFNEQNGFCNFHSYKFLRYNDGLAVSLVYKDLLLKRIKLFNGIYPITIIRKMNNSKDCLVCELALNAEKRYISEMIKYVNDDEFKNEFMKSKGLCIPHTEILVKRIKKLPKWIHDFNLTKYKELSEKLDKYIESCNVSIGENRPVLSQEEALEWRKVVGILYGFEGRPSTI